jgi:hypothetical protein
METKVTGDPDGHPTADFGTSSGLPGFTPHDGDEAFGYIYAGAGMDVPTTLSQMIIGFGLAGATLRTRRRAVSVG